MRKITFLPLLLACTLSYSHENNIDLDNDIEVVEILDESLEEINYYQTEFEKPTKLVFSNLHVVGKVFFAETFNLVEIEFPKLETVNGSFTLAENFDLKFITSEKLEFIDENLSVFENTELEKFEFYKLKRIGDGLSFRENHNLQRIEFSVLEEIVGPILLKYNSDLKEIKFHKLLIINDLLLVQGHHELRVLEICNLKRIIQTGEQPPVILIANESEYLDDSDLCFDLEFPENIEILNGENIPQADEQPILEDEPIEEEDSDETQDVEEIRVSLHPNPAEDIVQIESEIAFDKIEIYDLSGNLIKSFRPTESGYDVSDIAAGMYIMIIYHKGSIYGTVEKLAIR